MDRIDNSERRVIDVVFDGPPGHESGRFVEVEDEDGRSINVGQWVDRGNGLWALRIVRRDERELNSRPSTNGR